MVFLKNNINHILEISKIVSCETILLKILMIIIINKL